LLLDHLIAKGVAAMTKNWLIIDVRMIIIDRKTIVVVVATVMVF